MLKQISNISFNSSSKSSASSALSVKDVMKAWGTNPVASCILGISKIGFASDYINKISHAALLLLDKSIDYETDDDETIQSEAGILVEYGDYKPDMCPEEKKYVDKGLVKYHYGNKGGLRYYGKRYGEFIEVFGDIGYIDLNIHPDNQNSFDFFLDKIAKVEENKWIKENYNAGITNNFNCQNFAVEAIIALKPYFVFANINPRAGDLINKKSYLKKLEFVPENIKTELLKHYIKG
jgi:hypothetical protein